jgi:hypothetical protein
MANREANRLSTCPVCEDINSDQRILPCGQRVCIDCIDRQLTFQRELDCTLCDEIHKMPPNGFPYDLRLNRFRTALKTESSVEFENLETELNSLDHLKVDESRDFYNRIRSRVELETAILVQSIQQLNLEFYNQIDKCENSTSAKANELVSKFYLHREEQVKKLFSIEQDAVMPSSNLERKAQQNLKKIDLKTELMPNVFSSYFKIVRLSETKSILAFIDTKFSLNVKVFDNNGATLREHANLLDGFKISAFNFVVFNSNYAFYIKKREEYSKFSINNHSIVSHRSRMLFLVDSDFHYVNHVELKLDVEKMATNKKNIFALDSANKVTVYAGDLAFYRSNFEYDVHPLVRFMDASEENLVFLHVESKKMRIVSIESGKCELTIPCRASQLKVTSNGHLILLFENRGSIFNYDLRTGKLGMVYASPSAINSSVSLTRDKSDLLSFFDQSCFSFF